MARAREHACDDHFVSRAIRFHLGQWLLGALRRIFMNEKGPRSILYLRQFLHTRWLLRLVLYILPVPSPLTTSYSAFWYPKLGQVADLATTNSS